VKRLFWLALFLWLGVSLLTLTAYPAVWGDEILSADAGIHLAQGKGFVSAAWFNQPSTELWASYPPLYALLLAGWLKALGVTAFVVRSFGLGLVAASLLMILFFLKRLVDHTTCLMIILALAVCEPLAFLERAGRPDSVSVLLLCATALVFVERTWRWRDIALFVLGVLAVPAALQYAAFVLILGALVQIWFRAFTRREIMIWIAGAATGAALLAGIYAAHHVLRIFLESTVASTHSSAGRFLQNLLLKNGATAFVFSDIATAPLRDWASPVLIAGGLIVWLAGMRSANGLAQKLSSFGVVCAIVIPLAIQLLGKYPLYYGYMGTAPATIAVMAACGKLARKARFANILILALLFAGGAGRFWWKAWSQGTQTVYESLSHVSSEDTVVADYTTYYQLLGHVQEFFAVDYAGGKVMPYYPPEQAARVTKLFVRDSKFAAVAKKVGGKWQRISEVIVLRHDTLTDEIVIDDDTRNPTVERIGIYVRTGGNKNLSASGAR
jgi:hypothetical protein